MRRESSSLRCRKESRWSQSSSWWLEKGLLSKYSANRPVPPTPMLREAMHVYTQA